MRGIFAILILMLSITSATTSKSRTKRMRRFSPSPSLNPSPSPRQSPGPILKSNNLLIAHSAVLAMNRRYHLRGSSGVVLAHSYPRSYGIKTKSGHPEGRGVMTQTCWFKHHSKCPRNSWFSRSLPVKEAEESDWDMIGRKIIEQGILQALALDGSYTPKNKK